MRRAALLVVALAGCTRSEAPVAPPVVDRGGAWVMDEGDGGCRYIPPEEWARQTAEVEAIHARDAREYEEACRDGDHASCSLLASQYAAGQGVERSSERATTYYQRSQALERPLCERGD
ncbi:MAG TPA: hypothetical protein VLT33_34305, partial [Labilithrix sp.]|nr:hypothetical protein [Labilithrix sp.]